MQLMGCNRSLFARFNVACVVPRFNVSRPAATSYPKNKEWDYFKGIIPMSAVASRRWFQGSRTLAEHWVDHLKKFKDLMDSGYKLGTKVTYGSTDPRQDYPKLTDGSHGHKEDAVKNRGLTLQFKIVWIPVVQQWNEQAQNDFVMLRSDMRWYAMSPKLEGDIEEKWGYNNSTPILIVMDPFGRADMTDLFPSIQEGVQHFPFDKYPI